MYLWDTNILRAFTQGNPILRSHIDRVAWSEIALPSVVFAEVLRGRCDAALKATPHQLVDVHRRLLDTQSFLQKFQIASFDEHSAKAMQQLQQKHRRSKRYADMMIAAIAIANNHIVVTRNSKDFSDLLPAKQLQNWIDNPPS